MKRLRKIISAVLVICMLAVQLPVIAGAEETDSDPHNYEDSSILPEVGTESDETSAPTNEGDGATIPSVSEEMESATVTEPGDPEDSAGLTEPEYTETAVRAKSEEPGILAEGSCGENLTWKLEESGVLTISGEGEMEDYYNDYDVPWADYRSQITSAVIEEGVSSIGGHAFYDCSSLTCVSIPEGVTSIGELAFGFCNSLKGIWVSEENPNYSNDEFGVLLNKEKSILMQCPGGMEGEYIIPDSVTSIADSAFNDCSSLTEITFSGNAPSFGSEVFYQVTATAWYPAGDTTWTEDVMQDYGGTITWVSYESGEPTGPEPTEPKPTEPKPTEPESDILAEGSCGESVTWKLDENGVLTISGEGEMEDYDMGDYDDENDAPWWDYRSQIISAVIEEGVSSIGDYAFYECRSMTSVSISEGVTHINQRAFELCISLTDLSIPPV